MSNQLTTVHQALAESAFEQKSPGSPTSFRLDEETKDFMTDLCARHGTKLSAFLRQCCIAVKREYESSPSPSEE